MDVVPKCPHCGEDISSVNCIEYVTALMSQHKVKLVCCPNCRNVLGTTLADDIQNKIDMIFNKAN
ncbi:hypothetical protein St703_18780 [Sporolactobacillus terrae]|uniref:Uncharacterized protein n=1 Tax=Sporolactobacillus terrae TaxID=269673 RepID=A0A5K7X3F1_9BACL|nr:hypothetical protein St703_18780 [Sporolactobacillus terrae]